MTGWIVIRQGISNDAYGPFETEDDAARFLESERRSDHSSQAEWIMALLKSPDGGDDA